MSDLRVPTIRQPVTITCVGGRVFEGDVFLPARSGRHPGAMRPEEWSATVQTFFPFLARGAATCTILNLRAVVAFTTPVDGADAATEADDVAAVDAPVSRVTVDTGAATFEGRVIIDTPPVHCRVADLLNAPAAFVLVRALAVHHLIQKRHITRVIEMPQGGN
jgi:hypothetical protein